MQTGERRSDRSRDDQRRGGMPIDLRTSLSPDEAATRLPIHAEAVPPAAIADQALQVVPWRHPEVLVVLRRMDQLQPPQWIAPGVVEGVISPGGWSHACTEEVSR